MKPVWEYPLAHRLMQSATFTRCWRPIRPLYHGIIRAYATRFGIYKNIQGREFRLCYENRKLQSWMPEVETQWMLSSVSPGMCVFDIGASFGLESIIFARAVGPTGKVCAFEPSPRTFHCLCENVRLNKLSGTVSSYPYAMGNHTGTIDFYVNDDPTDMTHSAIRSADEPQKTIPVKAVSTDVFCAEWGQAPDVIKIDVEGFEPMVLEGARETIRQTGRLTIFVELHPWAWGQIGYDAQRFLQLVEQLGLRALTPEGAPARAPLDKRAHLQLVKP